MKEEGLAACLLCRLQVDSEAPTACGLWGVGWPTCWMWAVGCGLWAWAWQVAIGARGASTPGFRGCGWSGACRCRYRVLCTVHLSIINWPNTLAVGSRAGQAKVLPGHPLYAPRGLLTGSTPSVDRRGWWSLYSGMPGSSRSA
jgi:hypothetical protein